MPIAIMMCERSCEEEQRHLLPEEVHRALLESVSTDVAGADVDIAQRAAPLRPASERHHVRELAELLDGTEQRRWRNS
jgi:hypothetical protein